MQLLAGKEPTDFAGLFLYLLRRAKLAQILGTCKSTAAVANS